MPVTLPTNVEVIREALERADKASRVYNSLSPSATVEEREQALNEMLEAQQAVVTLVRDAVGEPEEEELEEGDVWISIPEAAVLLDVARPTITNNLSYYMAHGLKFKRTTPHRVKVSKRSVERFLEKLEGPEGVAMKATRP
ncbi:MAG: hypothetical protein U0641_05610 [Anaerolineae bacterium]